VTFAFVTYEVFYPGSFKRLC